MCNPNKTRGRGKKVKTGHFKLRTILELLKRTPLQELFKRTRQRVVPLGSCLSVLRQFKRTPPQELLKRFVNKCSGVV